MGLERVETKIDQMSEEIKKIKEASYTAAICAGLLLIITIIGTFLMMPSGV